MNQPVGIYIHIPFCTTKCPYCDFVSFSADENLQREYINAIIKEIENAPSGLTIDTIFIGGGTPSALYRGGLTQISKAIKNKFSISYDLLEITSEANPESCNLEFVKECISIGVNRLSLGLQTASDKLLKELRRHDYNDFLQSVEFARQNKIKNINADLMLGLPFQTEPDIRDSIQKLIDLKIPHISVYGLKIEENTPLYKGGYCIDDDKLRELYDLAYKILCKDNSYIRYEVSNFCLKGYECKHNQKYWRLLPYLGFGLNASSCFEGYRTRNTADIKKYISRNYVDYKESSEENFITEYIMLGLRTNQGIDINLLKYKGIDLTSKAKIKDYINKGILILKDNSLIISENYYYLMDSIIVDII